MGTIHLRLPAIELSRIQAAVDARVMQSTRSNPEHPNPSLGYQRAMALVELTTGADSRNRTADDAAGRSAAIPVNASVRRRHPTTRQKRVVDERNPRCVDCGGTELLEYDHQPPYSITKRTHTDELARRCHGCHSLRRNSDPSSSPPLPERNNHACLIVMADVP
jgi:hypothetical protein